MLLLLLLLLLLRSRETLVSCNSLAAEVYGFPVNNNTINKKPHVIKERHRHRYEVNPDKVQDLEKAGLIFSGRDVEGVRMEVVELSKDKHPFFFAVQFHPEVLLLTFL